MERSEAHFGVSLRGAGNAALRARVEALAATLDRPLVVDSVLALSGEGRRESRPALSRPVASLLFDPPGTSLFYETRCGRGVPGSIQPCVSS